MKRFWKVLEYIGVYLLVTVGVAAGIIWILPGRNLNAGGNPNTEEEPLPESALTKMVENLMSLENFNVTAGVDLIVNEKTFRVSLDCDIALGGNLNNINAAGNITLFYNEKPYQIDLVFVQGVLYASFQDTKISLSTTNLMSGINDVIALTGLPVALPDLGAFDVAGLTDILADITEKETNTGYEFSLPLLGADIFIACDKDVKVQTISVAHLTWKQLTVNAEIALQEYKQALNIVAPTDEYFEVTTVVNLAGYLNQIKESQFLGAELHLALPNYHFDSNLAVDWHNGIRAQFATDSLGTPLKVTYADKTLFADLADIKIKLDVCDLLGLIPQPLIAKLPALSDLTTQLQGMLSTITLDDVLVMVNCIHNDGDNLIFELPGKFNITIKVTNDVIQEITATAGDIYVCIDNISTTPYEIDANPAAYLDFAEVYNAVNEIIVSEFLSAELHLTLPDFQFDSGFAIDWHNGIRAHFDTNSLGAYLGVTYFDETLFAEFAAVKVKMELSALLGLIPQPLVETLPALTDLSVQLQSMLATITWNDVLTMLDCIHTEGNNLSIEIPGKFSLSLRIANEQIKEICIAASGIAIRVDNIDTTTQEIAADPDDYIDFGELYDLINEFVAQFDHQFTVAGSAYLYEAYSNGDPKTLNDQYTNYVEVDLNDLKVDSRANVLHQLAIDVDLSGKGSLYTDGLLGDRAEGFHIDVQYNSDETNGAMYINLDGLKISASKASLAAIYEQVKRLLPVFIKNKTLEKALEVLYFTDENDARLNLSVVTNLLPKKEEEVNIIDMISQYATLLTALTMDKDGVLSLTVDVTGMNKYLQSPLTISFFKGADSKFHLAIDNLYLGDNQGVCGEFTFMAVDPFIGEPTNKNKYTDISAMEGLLDAVNNTIRHKEFNIHGTVHITLGGNGLDTLVSLIAGSPLKIDVDLSIKLDDELGPIVSLAITKIPVICKTIIKEINLNDDIKKSGYTNNGDRSLNIYYQQGFVYLHRTEPIKKPTNSTYEKTMKLKLNDFTADLLPLILQWGLGLQSLVMDPINEAIETSQERTDPIKYNKILPDPSKNEGVGFAYNESKKSYTMKLNLGEIVGNDKLGFISFDLATQNQDNKNYLSAISTNLNFKLGTNAIKLGIEADGSTDKSTPLYIKFGDGQAKVATALNYIKKYNFEVNQEMYTGDGGKTWKEGTNQFKVTFDTPVEGFGGTYKIGTVIELPVIKDIKRTEDGKGGFETYYFAGWCLDEGCTGKVYKNTYTVGRNDITFYAKWNLIERQRAIEYTINGETVATQIAPVKSSLMAVPVADYEEYLNDGQIKQIWTFDYWVDVTDTNHVITEIEDKSLKVKPCYKLAHEYYLRTITFDTVYPEVSTPAAIERYHEHEIGALPTCPETIVVNRNGWSITYRFDGWDWNGTPFTAVLMPNENIALTAHWTEIARVAEHKITIHDGANTITTTLPVGDTINWTEIIDNQFKVESTTLWYDNAAFAGEPIELKTLMPDEDIELWVRNQYVLTYEYYDADHNKVSGNVTLYQGDTSNFELVAQISYEEDVADKRVGGRFNGYYMNGTLITDFVMPNQDSTLIADWTFAEKRYCTVKFNTTFVDPSSWNGTVSNRDTSQANVSPIRVLEGSTIKGTTLYKATLFDGPVTETCTAKYTCSYRKQFTIRSTSYTFKVNGWNSTKCTNGTFSNATIEINNDITVYAEWKQN